MAADGRYGGVVKITGELYFADRNNSIGEAIENFANAKVDVDVDQIVASRFSAEIPEFRVIDSYKSMLAPFLTVTYLDAQNPGQRITQRAQLGLFTLLPSSRDITGGKVIQYLEAYDMMWLLSQRYASVPITLPIGTNPVAYIRTKLATLGFPRHRVTSTSHTLTKEFTWREGASWVSIFNDLLDAIGYYRLWADRTGTLVSSPYRQLRDVQAQAEFTTDLGDIGSHVKIEPDQEWVKNDIIVLANSPTNDAIVSRRTNVDPNSKTSIYALRTDPSDDPVYLTLIEENPAIETQAAADALANRLLEERSSMFYRMEIETVPYPGLDLREPIDLFIETDAGEQVADGKWWWDQLRIGFSPRDGGMKMRCNNLLPFESI